MPYSNPSKKKIFLSLLNGQVANEMNSNKVILGVPRRSGIGSKNVVPWRINVGQHNIHFITGKRNPRSAEKQCNGAAAAPPANKATFLTLFFTQIRPSFSAFSKGKANPLLANSLSKTYPKMSFFAKDLSPIVRVEKGPTFI